jgi:serine/threonine protein kinase
VSFDETPVPLLIRAPEATEPPTLDGALLAGRYRLVRLIGRGGSGEVYEALQHPLERRVAVKLLSRELAADPLAMCRFEQEARLVSRLKHPHTITLHDFGQTDDGRPFLVTELLEGRSLREELEAHGALDPRRVARLGLQLCGSLAEAHAQKIVHRDLKPANVALVRVTGREDFAKVLDFGIAHLIDAPLEARGSTDTVGTPRYMAPEQFLRPGEVDHRADLYSLGVMLYELLAGRPPFGCTSITTLILDHLQRPAPRFAELVPQVAVDPELEAVILRALAKDPRDRFPSALHLAAALLPWARLPPPLVSLEPRREELAPASIAPEPTSGASRIEPRSTPPPLPPSPKRAPAIARPRAATPSSRPTERIQVNGGHTAARPSPTPRALASPPRVTAAPRLARSPLQPLLKQVDRLLGLAGIATLLVVTGLLAAHAGCAEPRASTAAHAAQAPKAQVSGLAAGPQLAPQASRP